MSKPNYTKAENEFVVKAIEGGQENNEIAELWNTKFPIKGPGRTAADVEHIARKNTKTKKQKPGTSDKVEAPPVTQFKGKYIGKMSGKIKGLGVIKPGQEFTDIPDDLIPHLKRDPLWVINEPKEEKQS